MAEERSFLDGIPHRLRIPVYQYHQYQGRTNDCGPTSLAIAANALRQAVQFDGDEVAEILNRPVFRWTPLPHIVIRRIRNWATFPWGIVQYLREEDIPARWRMGVKIGQLVHNLHTDLITLVIVGQPWRVRKWRYVGWAHVKVLYGYAPDRGYLFVDPAYARDPEAPDPWRRYGLVWQSEQEFLDQWGNMGRIVIEVGDVS
jgi:hypothetical protein